MTLFRLSDASTVLFCFPTKECGFKFLLCKIREAYKTAICCEYSGYAVIMFPILLEYEFLFGENFEFLNIEAADCFREILDIILHNDSKLRDKYGIVEKLRKYIFSCVENYLAFSLFENQSRSVCSLSDIYNFLHKRVINIAHKAGYRIEIDFSELGMLGEGIFTDTAYFTTVFSSMLLFCLSVAENGRCIVTAENTGTKIRNKIQFSYPQSYITTLRGQSLKDFVDYYPIEYFNVMPYEEICRTLGWEISYSFNQENDFNALVCFDINIETSTVFNSSGNTKPINAEEYVGKLVSLLFANLL